MAWLSQRFREPRTVPGERIIAASALVGFIHSPVELADLALDSSEDVFPTLLEALKRDRPGALAALRGFVISGDRGGSDAKQEHAARRRAVAAVALLRMGADDDCWSLLRRDDDPDFRTALVDRCARFGTDPHLVLAHLDEEEEPASRASILLMLAEFLPDASDELRARIAAKSRTLHQHDLNAGVHFAAEWVLGQLGEQVEVREVPQAAPGPLPTPTGWQVSPHGISMVVVRGPRSLVMGSPDSETEREVIEPQRKVEVARSFAIGAYEITVEQFQRYVPEVDFAKAVSKSLQCPMSNVRWYDAVKYCRRLSEAEGIAESQMCYPPVDQIGPEMNLPADCLLRTGYRLPEESEWECACRAETATARFFGRSPSRLVAYGRYIANSGEHLWPVGSLRPNPWGLFDVYGNVLEWCHDEDASSPSSRVTRSGMYRSVERENRSAKRYVYSPSSSASFHGFRIARTIPD